MINIKFNRNIKFFSGLFLIAIVLLTVNYVWGNYEGMKYLARKYGENSVIQKSADIEITTDKGGLNGSRKVIIIKRNSFNSFNKENKISYNSEKIYMADYLQTNYCYVAGELIVRDVSDNPAGADRGWITWFDNISIFPSFTIVEMEIKAEENRKYINLEDIALEYEVVEGL